MNSHPTTPELIEAKAAEWLSRCDGGLTAKEQVDLDAWLDQDPRHRTTFAALASVWTNLDDIAGTRTARELEDEAETELAALDRRRRNLKWTLLPLASAAVLIFAFLIAYPKLNNKVSSERTETVATEVGGFRQTTLGDGSLIELNTDTQLHIAFSIPERRLSVVQGEAHFTVAKDASRPFVVTVGSFQVKAVGTAFNLRFREDRLEVVVTEGRVEILPVPTLAASFTGTNPPIYLEAGAFLRLSSQVALKQSRAQLSADNQDRLLAWRNRRLVFDGAPLAEVIAELNRYRLQPLVIEDPALAARTFGGTIPIDDASTLLALLEKSFGVVADRQSEKVVLRPAP